MIKQNTCHRPGTEEPLYAAENQPQQNKGRYLWAAATTAFLGSDHCSLIPFVAMPPRLLALPLQLQQFLTPSLQSASPLSSVLPQLHLQTRNAHILSSLSDTPGAYNKRIRRGRGPASGKGKTSGRGHKGQKQHGKVPAGFNGGQTPDIVVHGERGEENMYVSGWLLWGKKRPYLD